MAVATLPMLLPKKSQDGLKELHKQCSTIMHTNWNIRERMRAIDLSYAREKDQTKENQRAKLANRYGDSSKLQNITVPIVLPQVEAAVTYQASVFLTGIPLFGVTANPSFMDEALQLETIIDENATRGGWVREFMLFFRDGFKYNYSALEVTWDSKVTASFDTSLTTPNGAGKTKEVIWSGNCINRWDPYNTYLDTRVNPTEVATRGEWAGHTVLMSRIELKAFINTLPTKIIENLKPAFESGFSGSPSLGESSTYYTPSINPQALLERSLVPTTDWMAWAELSGSNPSGAKIHYKNMYEVSIEYVRIMPIDFNLKVPSSSTPQVWKLIWINHSVVIYAERQTNAHELIPVLIGQPLEDGLGYQTKSLAQNVEPFQDITSTLWNSVIAARRRSISDRGIYDPSRIAEHHINNPNPSAKMPVRPAAYGKPVSEAYYPIPFEDRNSSLIMQETQPIARMADAVSGHNQAQQGQFVKGNKTQHEYADVMNHANGRDQMTSLLYEAQIFTPLKNILKINVLQYQGGTTLYNKTQEVPVVVDPVALRKAVLEFKVSDGLTPSDKLIHADTLQVAMQVIGSSPQISAGYNIAPLFSYLMKTQGADLRSFEKSPQQMAYEQAQQAWQSTVMELAKQGVDPSKYPQQPLPQNYGYAPAGNGVATQDSQQPTGAPNGNPASQ